MATSIHNIKMYRISALEETEYHLDVSTKKTFLNAKCLIRTYLHFRDLIIEII